MKNIILNTLIGVFALLTLVSCIEAGSDEGGTFKVIDPITVGENDPVTFAMLKQSILEPMCLRCHSWVSDEAKVDTRIVPGNPDGSSLFRIVESGSMPVGGPALTLDQLDIVRRYIADKGKDQGTGGGDVTPNPNPNPNPNPGDDNGNDDDDDDNDDDDDIDNGNGDVIVVAPTYQEINEKLIAPKCLRCHSDMGSEQGLRDYYVPGRSNQSLLYERVADGSMPRRGPPLTEDELLLVRRFIDNQ